jgi:SpoVK/Ycf46/Vps4 family AAA+-type ATPase
MSFFFRRRKILIFCTKGVPNPAARLEILTRLLRGVPHSLTDGDLSSISARAHGFVGADIAAVCREAGMKVIQRAKRGKFLFYQIGRIE